MSNIDNSNKISFNAKDLGGPLGPTVDMGALAAFEEANKPAEKIKVTTGGSVSTQFKTQDGQESLTTRVSGFVSASDGDTTVRANAAYVDRENLSTGKDNDSVVLGVSATQKLDPQWSVGVSVNGEYYLDTDKGKVTVGANVTYGDVSVEVTHAQGSALKRAEQALRVDVKVQPNLTLNGGLIFRAEETVPRGGADMSFGNNWVGASVEGGTNPAFEVHIGRKL